jgi:EpsD family peptidyl-prolyl cis-trans isomerase
VPLKYLFIRRADNRFELKMFPKSDYRSSSLLTRTIVGAAFAFALGAISGCGEKEKGTTQVLAKVNKEEISVHQVNFLLSRQQGIRPGQSSAVSRQILERLIDQEVALQKAYEFKFDRDPEVVQAIEAARRDIISRAYIDRVSETASRPNAEDVKKYFEEKPSLFAERRVYQLHEFSVELPPSQIDGILAQLKQVKGAADFAQYLRSKEIRFVSSQSVRPSEQLPLAALDTFAKTKDGQAVHTPTAEGLEVVFVITSHAAPVDEASARPAIQQFLLNERRRQVVERDIKSLREASKIEYVGASVAAVPAPTTAALPPALALGASSARTDVIK